MVWISGRLGVDARSSREDPSQVQRSNVTDARNAPALGTQCSARLLRVDYLAGSASFVLVVPSDPATKAWFGDGQQD